MKHLLIFMFLSILLNAKTITIAVSANVSFAIDSLIKEFNRVYPDIKVQTIIGSSGKLTAQIEHNAPYDIFMSADMNYPFTLYRDNFAITYPLTYAKGALILLSRKDIDLNRSIDKILEDKNIKKIAIANPKTAPYGIATIEALKNIKLFNNIKSKFVYGESISQTVSYTIKVADIGIIAKSVLYNPKIGKYKNYKEIDLKLYTPISQGIVLLKHAKNNMESSAFYTFIFSKNARDIFKKFGYILN